MPNPRRRVKDEFWFGVIVVALIVYSSLTSWWKEHAILGWSILGILLAVIGYVVYRYASLRGWLGRQAKDTVKNVVFKKIASEREFVPPNKRDEVLRRSRYGCANERCYFQGKPEIHHIDMNNQHNNLNNLIALCPNCHQQAHDGIFSESQLINWVRRDYKRLQARRAQR